MSCKYFQLEDGTTGILTVHESPIYSIIVSGKPYRFAMHEQLGPCPVNKDGTDRQTRYPKKFWEAVTWWYHQGHRVKDGFCIWDTPEDEMKDFVHVVGRQYVHKSIA